MTTPRIADRSRTPGVHYAVTNDGLELPIVDITHPAFAQSVTDADQRALVERFLSEKQPFHRLPAPMRNVLLRFFLRGSVLAHHIRRADRSFLSGMATYLMKLGPDNLGAYATPVDRRIAGSFPPLTMRWRLQDVARLLADALEPIVRDEAGGPVHLINIAGGTALDSLNALLLLRRDRPAALVGRRVVVSVLDGDRDGPAFGARALAAWQVEGAPLHGLEVTFRHVPYDWRRAQELRSVLEDARADGARIAGSSEGGLFEYGSDDEIVDNLSALRRWAPDDFVIVGSVTRADAPVQRLLRTSTATIRPRGLSVFRELVRRGGFGVARTVERPFSDHVVLTAAAAISS